MESALCDFSPSVIFPHLKKILYLTKYITKHLNYLTSYQLPTSAHQSAPAESSNILHKQHLASNGS